MVGVTPIRINVTQEVGFDSFNKNTNIPRAAMYKMSPLHELLWFEDKEGTEKYLKETDPAELKQALRQVDKDGRSPLMYAIVSRQIPLVKMLLDAGAPVNYATEEGFSALYYAIYHNGKEIFDLLLQKEANVNVVSKGRHPITPLQFACARGQVSPVAKLLQQGAEVEVYYESQGEKFNTLMLTLHSAEIDAAPSREAICELLVDKNVNTQLPRTDGCTPLICAIDHNFTSFSTLLLERNLARVDKIAADKCTTALWVAMQRKNVKIMNLLLERNAAAETGKSRSSPLHAAVISDFPEGVKALLELGIPVMWMDHAGFTSVHYAACLKNTECLKLLLAKGVNVEVPAKRSGFSPLVVAALKGNNSGIEVLLENNAKLEAYDKNDGITALIASIVNNHPETTKFLISKGADIMTRRLGNGMTPLMNAIGLQRDDIRDILCEAAKEQGKKGELRKQGGGHRSKAWKKRTFVLYGTYCFYYKSILQVAPQGIIILDNAKIENSSKGPLALQIVTPARIYQVKADTEEIRNDWFNALTESVESYQPESKPSQTFTIEGKIPEFPRS